MNVVSFYAPRPDHPFFQDYTPFLNLLRESCERYGHKHVVLTDDPSVGDDAYVSHGLPHNLMLAFLQVQYDYLSDPMNAGVPTLLTGADCVLAADPKVFSWLIGDADILVTVDDRFTDCRINMGAIFIPNPEKVAHVWADAIERCGGEWGDDQRAFRDALAVSRLTVAEVACDPYNLAPLHPADDEAARRGVVLHFRGPRKAWMTAYCREWLEIGPGVRVKIATNTDAATAAAQIRENLKTPRETLDVSPARHGVAVIVGSGPSARDDLPLIRDMVAHGATVFGLNGAVRWLMNEGITPDFGVMLDMREGNTRFIEGCRPLQAWLIASHCHPAVFAAAGDQAIMYHFGAEEMRPHLPPGAPLVGGGPTVGMTAMVIAAVMGFRRLNLFGFDSSFRDSETHLLAQPMTDEESRIIEVWHGPARFLTNIGMYAQAEAFSSVVGALKDAVPDIEIAVHGAGLLPSIARELAATYAAAQAKVDHEQAAAAA